jgi:hypothetical protein
MKPEDVESSCSSAARRSREGLRDDRRYRFEWEV